MPVYQITRGSTLLVEADTAEDAEHVWDCLNDEGLLDNDYSFNVGLAPPESKPEVRATVETTEVEGAAVRNVGYEWVEDPAATVAPPA